MVAVEQLNMETARPLVPQLARLLQDTVADGASVGFLPPLADDEATGYWAGVLADLDRGKRILLVVREDERVLGSAQLELAARPNAAHRAEVQRLIVAPDARRRGLGGMLMATIEGVARRVGRTLLVLDTRAGDAAETLYLRRGYTRVGVIPGYARGASGTLDATVIFYRAL